MLESLSSIASEKLDMFSAATQRKSDAMPRSVSSARVILVGRCTMRGHAAISAIKFFL